MSAFSEFFLMKPDDVKRYAAEVLHRFDPDEETTCTCLLYTSDAADD